jgi:hypothetical protein
MVRLRRAFLMLPLLHAWQIANHRPPSIKPEPLRGAFGSLDAGALVDDIQALRHVLAGSNQTLSPYPGRCP